MILWIVRKLLALKAKNAELYGLVHCPSCRALIFVTATLCNEEMVSCDKCHSEWRVANNASDLYIPDWLDQLAATTRRPPPAGR